MYDVGRVGGEGRKGREGREGRGQIVDCRILCCCVVTHCIAEIKIDGVEVEILHQCQDLASSSNSRIMIPFFVI